MKNKRKPSSSDDLKLQIAHVLSSAKVQPGMGLNRTLQRFVQRKLLVPVVAPGLACGNAQPFPPFSTEVSNDLNVTDTGARLTGMRQSGATKMHLASHTPAA